MNRFKFQAFLEEFPFLSESFKLSETRSRDEISCDGIQVKRLDANLLTRVPRYSGATGSLVGIDDGERIDFVLADGTIIRDAVAEDGYCIHNEAHQDNESWEGETVLEAIDRHDVADALAFIVEVDYGYHIRNHYSQSDWRAVVYKPARNLSLAKVIAEARARAKAEVEAEANF